MKELISLKEAAEILEIVPETFRRKRAKGYFPNLEFSRYGEKGKLRVSRDSVIREKANSIVEDPLTI